MRSYFRHIPRLICLVLALAACQDDSTAPIRTETEPILDESISGEMGTGYLVGRSGLPFAIRFVVSNGRAIWLGHVDIGPG